MSKGLITSWSISRLNTYEECPLKAKYKFVDKLQEPSSPAMERGTRIHELAEKYLKLGGRVATELAQFRGQFKDLRKAGALSEADFTFTADWKPTRWDDWAGAWCRAKADAVVPPTVDADTPMVRVIDFKTGRVKEHGEYDAQLELYGLAGLLTYPVAQVAVGELWFLDHGQTVKAAENFAQKDTEKLKKKWAIRTKAMLSATVFKPKPGNACRWCHFRRDNGGPCKF